MQLLMGVFEDRAYEVVRAGVLMEVVKDRAHEVVRAAVSLRGAGLPSQQSSAKTTRIIVLKSTEHYWNVTYPPTESLSASRSMLREWPSGLKWRHDSTDIIF